MFFAPLLQALLFFARRFLIFAAFFFVLRGEQLGFTGAPLAGLAALASGPYFFLDPFADFRLGVDAGIGCFFCWHVTKDAINYSCT